MPSLSATPTTPTTSTTNDQYDTPWKIALEQHFQAFIAFYFPLAHAQIDWTVKHEFLDKELQAITKDALVGTRHVDKLVKVRRLSGENDWLCIHIEVQVSRESKFAQRMFVYNYRIFDRYTRPVASIAVLGDDDPNWLPQQFGYAVFGCEMDFRFPVAKLARYAGQEAALRANPNPFALLTLAYLQNRATGDDMQARYTVKCDLIRLLYSHDWDGQLIRQFFLVIDWMMELPPQLAAQLSDFITELEEEQKMEYVSSIERIKLEQTLLEGKTLGREEGLNLGREEGLSLGRKEGLNLGKAELLIRLLQSRFGELPTNVPTKIHAASLSQIDAWFDGALNAASLEQIWPDLSH